MKKLFCAALAALAGLTLTLNAADLGDPAAKLEIAEWIKGQPVDVTDGKNIYVVEFWATWCPPCRTSIPHLTELQKKYKDKGIVFVGISDEKVSVVKPFVEKMGDKMDYRVAIDKDNACNDGYMKAYGIGGIPHAFVVDKKGKVIWQGHPMADLDKTLQQILDGKYDLAIAKKKAEAEKLIEQFAELAAKGEDEAKVKELGAKLEAIDKEVGGLLPDGKKFDAAELRKQIRFQGLLEEYSEALMEDKGEAELAKIAKQIKDVAPADFKLDHFKHDLFLQRDFQEYYRVISRRPDQDKAAELGKKIMATESTNPMLLNELSWAILTDKNVKIRDYPLALKLAKAAVDATSGKDENILDTYAKALFESGKKEEAIAQQKKAIELCKDQDRREVFEKTLKEYQDGAKEKK